MGAAVLLLVATPVLLTLDAIATGVADFSRFFAIYWAGFLSLFKAGAADGPWQEQVTRLAFAIIALFFTGAILGTVIRTLRDKVHQLQEKGGEVIATDHTILLGWSPLGFRIINELAIANRRRRHPRVLILSPEPKSGLESELAEGVSSQNTKLAVRSVSHVSINHLDLVRGTGARSVVVLGRWGSAKHDPDVVTSLLPLDRYRETHPESQATVVAGIIKSENLGPARAAAGPAAQIVPLEETASRMMFQVARHPGLIQVLTSLLSFEPNSISVARDPGLTGRTFREAVLTYEGSTPIAILHGGQTHVLPAMDTVIADEDQVVLIADNNPDVATAPAGPVTGTIPPPGPAPATAEAESWLHLGWSANTPDVLALHDLSVTTSSQVTVVIRPEHADKAGQLSKAEWRHLRVKVICWPRDQPLATVLEDVDLSALSRILIFVQRDPDGRPNDTSTLLVRMQIRDLLECTDSAETPPVVITELGEERFRSISAATDARDMLVGSEIVGRLLAQLSESPQLLGLYDELLGVGGAEIALRPVGEYVAGRLETTYASLVAASLSRGEIAIGFRLASQSADRGANFGVRLNPPKTTPLSLCHEDALIVIARHDHRD